jgi:hypothetical protein
MVCPDSNARRRTGGGRRRLAGMSGSGRRGQQNAAAFDPPEGRRKSSMKRPPLLIRRLVVGEVTCVAAGAQIPATLFLTQAQETALRNQPRIASASLNAQASNLPSRRRVPRIIQQYPPTLQALGPNIIRFSRRAPSPHPAYRTGLQPALSPVNYSQTLGVPPASNRAPNCETLRKIKM